MLVAFDVARTVMGPVTLVFTAVGDEVGALAECFPTILLEPFDEISNSYDIQ